MIALYMDENVEGQIVRGLRARGIDVITAEEDGRTETPDSEVLDRATALGRVAFSRDQDFLREAARRQRNGEAFEGVIYAHKIFVSLGKCIEDLEFLAEAGSPKDFTGRVYFLPL
jgi:hypothetical protein